MPSVRNTLFHASLLGLAACTAIDDSDAIDTDDSALYVPSTPDPFSFGGFWIIDRTDGSMAQAWKDGSVWRWPVDHDLRPRYVHLTWTPGTLQASAQAPSIADPEGGYTVQLWINGVKLVRGDDATTGDYWTTPTTIACPSGKTCLGTSVHA